MDLSDAGDEPAQRGGCAGSCFEKDKMTRDLG